MRLISLVPHHDAVQNLEKAYHGDIGIIINQLPYDCHLLVQIMPPHVAYAALSGIPAPCRVFASRAMSLLMRVLLLLLELRAVSKSHARSVTAETSLVTCSSQVSYTKAPACIDASSEAT